MFCLRDPEQRPTPQMDRREGKKKQQTIPLTNIPQARKGREGEGAKNPLREACNDPDQVVEGEI